MLKIYYRIWVSLFLKILHSQNGNSKVSLFLSLIVLVVSNFLNVFLICILLIILFDINSNFFSVLSLNKNLRTLSIFMFFLLTNYFLLVHNKKHEFLINKYGNKNQINLGSNYFIISCVLTLSIVFLMIIFPEIFNLKNIN